MKKRSYELLIANRKYKDTIFRWIFSQIENLLSLYNAVTGKHYQNPEELEIVTLENAIYMGMKNDLAFVLEMGLYLYEHQSTYNPNIPLRDLFYIASKSWWMRNPYIRLVFKRFRRRISWCFIMGQTGTFRIVQNCGCRMLLRIRCRIRRWN